MKSLRANRNGMRRTSKSAPKSDSTSTGEERRQQRSVYTADEVAKHNALHDLWVIVHGKVYNVSGFVDEHPGGEEVLLDIAGGDATEVFEDVGHSDEARAILESLSLGRIIGKMLTPKLLPVIKAESTNSQSGDGVPQTEYGDKHSHQMQEHVEASDYYQLEGKVREMSLGGAILSTMASSTIPSSASMETASSTSSIQHMPLEAFQTAKPGQRETSAPSKYVSTENTTVNPMYSASETRKAIDHDSDDSDDVDEEIRLWEFRKKKAVIEFKAGNIDRATNLFTKLLDICDAKVKEIRNLLSIDDEAGNVLIPLRRGLDLDPKMVESDKMFNFGLLEVYLTALGSSEPGQVELAMTLCTKLAKYTRKQFGKTHDAYYNAVLTKADLYFSQGNQDEAEAWCSLVPQSYSATFKLDGKLKIMLLPINGFISHSGSLVTPTESSKSASSAPLSEKIEVLPEYQKTLHPNFVEAIAPSAIPPVPTIPATPVVSSPSGPLAVGAHLFTTMGNIRLELFPDVAPKAVENFMVHLRNGYYDGVKFHRVIQDFMIQTGDPKGNGTGGKLIWDKPFEDEISPKYKHEAFALAAANAGPNTNGSQFFITVVKCPWLDGKHTVFGMVSAGDSRDVVMKISKVPQKGSRPIKDVKITSGFVVQPAL